MRNRAFLIGAILAVFLATLLAASCLMLGSVQSTFEQASDDITVADVGANASASDDDPDEVIYCKVLRDRITRAQCDHYTEIWSMLEVGAGGVEFPDTMVRGETETVSFALTAEQEDSEAALKDALGGAPDQTVRLKVGRKMAAQLHGVGFRIEPEGLQQQDLFLSDSTRWEWRVTPLRASRYRLLLSAYVVVPAADGSEKESFLKTLELPLSVEVTWGHKFGDFLDDSQAWLERGTNWLAALAGFLAALVGVLAYFKFRKPKTDEAG